jgi:hypothetical protein
MSHYHHHHHHHLLWLSLLARSFLKYQVIFFLAFLDHVFLSVDNIKVVWKLFLMASSVDVSTSFLPFVYVFLQLFILSFYLNSSLHSLSLRTEPATHRTTRISAASNHLSSVLLRVRVSPPCIRHGSTRGFMEF